MDDITFYSKSKLNINQELFDLILEFKENIEEFESILFDCKNVFENGFDNNNAVPETDVVYLRKQLRNIEDKYKGFLSILNDLINRNYLTRSEAEELNEPMFKLRLSDDGRIRLHILY